MRGKDPQKVIDDFHKRQRMMPFLVGGLAVILIVIGIIVLVVWFAGNNRPALALFASPTPTSTATFTPTPTVPTPTPTATSTITPTSAPTATPTPSGPFEYVVQEKDTCYDIAIKFKVDLAVLIAINNLDPLACPLSPKQKILIPLADQKLPTPTPEDITGKPKGFKMTIKVQPGDSLGLIAERYNTTVAAIMAIKENNLTDATKLFAGQDLIVPVNLNTPAPTKAPTKTTTPGPSATATKAP